MVTDWYVWHRQRARLSSAAGAAKTAATSRLWVWVWVWVSGSGKRHGSSVYTTQGKGMFPRISLIVGCGPPCVDLPRSVIPLLCRYVPHREESSTVFDSPLSPSSETPRFCGKLQVLLSAANRTKQCCDDYRYLSILFINPLPDAGNTTATPVFRTDRTKQVGTRCWMLDGALLDTDAPPSSPSPLQSSQSLYSFLKPSQQARV